MKQTYLSLQKTNNLTKLILKKKTMIFFSVKYIQS